MTGAKIHLKERDKILFTRNDYPLGLRNGSLGFIEEAMHATLPDSPVLRANFEGLRVDISAKDLAHLTHAYGITFHKSQGSQFKRVIVVLKRSRVLTREALYTALTRGVEQVVLVGSRKDLTEAVLTPPTSKGRHTLLGSLMRGS
jgi:exodeoxyribonuclease V alpha subunit